MEVSSHSLVQEKVMPISYEIGIFTNLSSEHMDFHNSMEAYAAAKATLFKQSKTGIFNCDDGYAEGLIREGNCDVRRCGIACRVDYRASDIELRGSHGVTYRYVAPGICLRIRTPLPGTFSVYNTLLALTAAIELGVPPHTAAEALATQAVVPGRMERLSLDPNADFSVFIDYAHTELALEALLKTVRAFRNTGDRIVLLFGCGGDRDHEKRAPMGRIAEELADAVILTSDNCRGEDPSAILNDILRGVQHPEAMKVIPNRKRAIETAILDAQKGDIILLAGKGHETYEVTASGIRHFDEREIVKAALKKRKNGDTNDEN